MDNTQNTPKDWREKVRDLARISVTGDNDCPCGSHDRDGHYLELEDFVESTITEEVEKARAEERGKTIKDCMKLVENMKLPKARNESWYGCLLNDVKKNLKSLLPPNKTN